jgi:phage FluMu gp28-like protein
VAKPYTEQLEDDKGYRFNNYVVEFPNGSRINCMSSNPRRFRSKGGDVCLDEFDWHDSPGEMLDAATPVTTWGFDISILTTRNGEGSEFDNLSKTAKRIIAGELDPDKDPVLPWSYHYTPITVAVAQGLAEKIYKLSRVDPQARERFIRECRAKCRSEEAFNQEYMCIASAAASTLIPYDLYQSCEMDNCLQPLVPHTEERRQYFMGGDIGREKHLTVFWIAELLGDVLITRKVVRLRKTPYAAQLAQAGDLLANNNITRCCIDATGIGDMLVETLQKRFGSYRVEKLKFTATLKEHLASLVRGRMEDKRCRVPAERQTRESFHSVRKTVTAAGNIRYDAASTDAGHADDFWAFATCCEAAKTIVVPECILL